MIWALDVYKEVSFSAQFGGTWVEIPDQVVDAGTDHVSFRKDDGTYWNSRDAHSLSKGSKPKCEYMVADMSQPTHAE